MLGSALLIVLYTAMTIREGILLEAAFGRSSASAGQVSMIPRLLLVDGLGVLGILVGVLLLRHARRMSLEDTEGPVTVHDGRSGTTIRRAAGADLEAARAVVLAGYRDLLGPDLHDTYAQELGDVEDRAANAEVLVAVDGDAVVGCVTYVPGLGPYAEFTDEDAAGIRMLAVDPDRQGRGIGMALVEACLERAQADGRSRVVLHSTEMMTSAQRLYARAGFVRAPERDIEIRPDLVLLGFERAL